MKSKGITPMQRFLLFFKKKQYSYDKITRKAISYKTLNSKVYILEEWIAPPDGYNCRHWFKLHS
jgi:hypothetical protein